MKNIRPEQYEAFQNQSLLDFERRAIEHLREDLSEHVEGISDSQLLEVIRLGMNSAEQYGLESEFEVICYIDTAIILRDAYFDRNPQYQSYTAILKDESLNSEDRAERLVEQAGDHHLFS